MASLYFGLTGISSDEAFGSPDISSSAVTQFRTDFPEFASIAQYPDSMILTWLNFAVNFLAPQCGSWGALLTLGTELVTAHYVVMASRDQTVAAGGGTPGTPTGLQTAKAVADVSTSYDYSLSTYAGAGFWNLTSYGQRYYAMARMFGAGAVQLGGCWW